MPVDEVSRVSEGDERVILNEPVCPGGQSELDKDHYQDNLESSLQETRKSSHGLRHPLPGYPDLSLVPSGPTSGALALRTESSLEPSDPAKGRGRRVSAGNGQYVPSTLGV